MGGNGAATHPKMRMKSVLLNFGVSAKFERQKQQKSSVVFAPTFGRSFVCFGVCLLCLTELRRAGRRSQLPLPLSVVIGAKHAVPPDDDAMLIHLIVDSNVQVHAISASARLACYRQHFSSRRRERGFLFRSGAVIVVIKIANHAWVAVCRVRGQVRRFRQVGWRGSHGRWLYLMGGRGERRWAGTLLRRPLTFTAGRTRSSVWKG